MCGFSGIASVAPVESREWLARGSEAMKHRGPNAHGERWSSDGRVGLAHRRLSIIDLSSGGDQPMLDGRGECSIVFNGEIYNFVELRDRLRREGVVFRTSTDTEVVLAAYLRWGRECLKHLNGMFAFVIHDPRYGKIFAARDRVGEKPFFYYEGRGQVRFASELKALFADTTLNRSIAINALDCYLAMGYVPGDMCILENYKKLPPGHAMEYSLQTSELEVWRYWQAPAVLPKKELSVDCLVDELERLLEDAVRRQLVADVPVGVLLSGGIDSSLITAFAARNVSRVKTFTIGFPGHGAMDETEHARLVARHFGTEHTELNAKPNDADIIPLLARQFDEPMADSSMIPTWLVSRLVSQHCTVALGGDGGDELFGGYGHHSRLLRMQKSIAHIPLWVRQRFANLSASLLPIGFKGRNWAMGMGVDLAEGLPLIASLFDVKSRYRLLSGATKYLPAAEKIFGSRVPVNADLLQRVTRNDFENYLPEDILVKVDRTSMLNSLEIRSPMLDYRIVEFAFGSVSSDLKANEYEKKILLKHLTTRVLPQDFDRKRKQGFSIPLNAWLKDGAFRNLFEEVLFDPGCFFDASVIQDLLRGIDRGRSNGERLFSLVIFELWRRNYNIHL